MTALMEDYSSLLNNVLKIRLKYLGTLTLAFIMIPSMILCNFSIKYFIILYSGLTVCTGVAMGYRFLYFRELINYENANLGYVNVRGGKSYRNVGNIGLECVVSLIFYIIIGNVYFKGELGFLNDAKKHQLPTVNPYFVYYYVFAIANGVFNSMYSYWFNEMFLSIDFTRFATVPKKQILEHLNINAYALLVKNYTIGIVSFLGVFNVMYYFFNVNQVVSRWVSIVVNLNAVDSLSFGIIFLIKLALFSIVLKLINYTVLVSFFKSYTLLGCLHFNQLISTYSNNDSRSVNLQLLFDGLKENNKDDLAKITILQELGYLALEKNPKFYDTISIHFNELNQQLELVLNENVTVLSTRSSPVKKTQTKNNSIQKHKSHPTIITDADVFMKPKSSFLKSTFDSISLKLVLALQDKNSTESFYVIDHIKNQLAILVKYLQNGKQILIQSLKLYCPEEKFHLLHPISLYYYITIFTLIVQNASLNNKLNNKILVNIAPTLVLLQKSIIFCEDYIRFNNINTSRFGKTPENYNLLPHQYTNQFLVLKLYQATTSCFLQLVSKHNDRLNELNLSNDVLKLSKRLLNSSNNKHEKDVAPQYTSFDVSVNY